jgi:hypothetical protein
MKNIHNQTKGQIYWNIRDQVLNQVSNKIYYEIDDQVKGQVWWQVRNQILIQVYFQIQGLSHEKYYKSS